MKNIFNQSFKTIGFIGLAATTFFSACREKPTRETYFPPLPQVEKKESFEYDKYRNYFSPLQNIAKNDKNALTEEKILLGKHLYFDTRLSKDGKNSCNSCHNLETFGVDNLSFSPGDLGENGGRNSPTTFNAAFHFLQFWDGRAADVEEQAGGPILNPVEMNIPSKEFLIDRLSKIDGYTNAFKLAFPDADTALTYWNVQQAIAAFERTLVTPSKFDEFLNGDNNALTEKELEGLASFANTGCISCHDGSLLGGTTFQKFGVYTDYWKETKSENVDNGRFDVTQQEADKYIFKVPSLRNIEKTSPYFHDGSVDDLNHAVKIMAKVQLNKELNENEIDNIVAFLATLTSDISDEQKAAPTAF